MFKEELIIIRHARSKHNIRDTDEPDAGITEFGEHQSRNVAQYLYDDLDLADHSWFTSPFLRCLQTTWPMCEKLGVTPEVMIELREYLNHGGVDCHVPHREEEFPHYDWHNYPEEGVLFKQEMNEPFLHRINQAYEMLPQKSVVVTHGLPAMTLLHVAISNQHVVPIWDHSIDNCSITVIRNGRVLWRGRNLFHEVEYDPKRHRRDYSQGITKHVENE